MKLKKMTMTQLINQNKQNILSSKAEVERIEKKIEEKHNKKLKITT